MCREKSVAKTVKSNKRNSQSEEERDKTSVVFPTEKKKPLIPAGRDVFHQM